MSDEEDKYKTHPAYGLVGFSRATIGGTRQYKHPLFGSNLETHSTVIMLQISSAAIKHDLKRDWIHPEEQIIEVELSPNQFAELLTTMNVGSGVPCTIRRHNGKQIEPLPPFESESDRIRSSFGGDQRKVARDLDVFRKKVADLLAKPNLTKADRTSILHGIEMFIQNVGSNVPFALTSFEEATDKVVAEAKAEVDAFMTHSIFSAGVTALTSNPETIPQLPAPAAFPEKEPK